jgi:hypothetical protein
MTSRTHLRPNDMVTVDRDRRGTILSISGPFAVVMLHSGDRERAPLEALSQATRFNGRRWIRL